MKRLVHTPLALALAAGLSLTAIAATPEPAKPTAPTAQQQKELDDAQQDLARAAKRVAELSRRYGTQDDAFHWEMRSLPGLPSLAQLPPLDGRPLVGVVLAPDDGDGVRIAAVTPGGAAADAGLKAGDRLVSVDGKRIEGATPDARVTTARDLLRTLDEKTPTRLGYRRDGADAEVKVTPRAGRRIMVFTGSGADGKQEENVVMRLPGDGRIDIDTRMMEGLPAGQRQVQVFVHESDDKQAKGAHAGKSSAGRPVVDRKVIRIECKGGTDDCKQTSEGLPHIAFAPLAGDHEIMNLVLRGDCEGKDCKAPLLAEAFRWNGLNLASVDAQLGRYFGTSDGVLVLSAGELTPLQPGDVIRTIDGKAVTTPREVMDALRGREGEVPVGFLRDRKTDSAKIRVPKAIPLPLSMPPAHDGHGMLPKVDVQRRVVVLDGEGRQIVTDTAPDASPSLVD